MPEYEPIALPDRADFSEEEMLRRARAFVSLMRTRRSVRAYSNRPVPEDIIRQAIAAAGTAPSGANHQPWHFVCIRDANTKEQIRIAAEQEEREFYAGKAGDRWLQDLEKVGTDAQKPFLEIAPWLIAIFAQRRSEDEHGSPRKNYYVPESVGIATGILITALHTAGLATLTHTPNPMKFLNKILHRPATDRPFLLLVVGYPADDAVVPKYALEKKSIEEIASFV